MKNGFWEFESIFVSTQNLQKKRVPGNFLKSCNPETWKKKLILCYINASRENF